MLRWRVEVASKIGVVYGTGVSLSRELAARTAWWQFHQHKRYGRKGDIAEDDFGTIKEIMTTAEPKRACGRTAREV